MKVSWPLAQSVDDLNEPIRRPIKHPNVTQQDGQLIWRTLNNSSWISTFESQRSLLMAEKKIPTRIFDLFVPPIKWDRIAISLSLYLFDPFLIRFCRIGLLRKKLYLAQFTVAILQINSICTDSALTALETKQLKLSKLETKNLNAIKNV